jgi:hypothetical protein
MVNVAEGVTGPDLPERLELVRAALPDADRGRFEQELTRHWTRRDQPGISGRSAMSWRPGLG